MLSRSTDKPAVEYCEDQNVMIIYVGALQGQKSQGRNESKPVLFEPGTVELQGTRIPHGEFHAATNQF